LAHGDWHVTDIVFDRGNGAFVPLTTLEKHHRAICAAATVQHIRLHDLRHTAATLLLEADVHPKVVSDILGHSSIAITMDRYAHVSDALQRAATSRLGDVLSGETQQRNPA
ncbi:MAG: tyrosine-type recombinase/integrase, partial [Thermomicrobiales bacterium]